MFEYDPPDVYLDPAWLTWNNNTVTNLVHAMMYEDRGPYLNRYLLRDEPQWDTMGIIADALEEAGCTEKVILDHLRGTEPCPHCGGDGARFYDEGERLQCKQRCDDCNGTGKRLVCHIRGCWLVELLTEGMQ
jgi:hypothetical protein